MNPVWANEIFVGTSVTSGETPTWTYSKLCKGIESMSFTPNEQNQQFFFLCGNGFAHNETTGGAPTLTISGRRIVGDAAQDYIFDNKFHLMAGRDTNLRISVPKSDGSVTRFTSKVTLSDMKSFGGATTDGGSVNVTLSFKGAPVVDTVAPTTALTVTSEYGGTVGTTVITITPNYPDAGCRYVYTYGDSVADAAIGDVIVDWNDLTSGFTYEIPNDKKITVAMVNGATFKVVGLGNATVVSASGT